MRRNVWVALGLAFAMLVAVPAEAGTRTKSTTKSTTAKRSPLGFIPMDADPDQVKIWWCPEGLQGAETGDGLAWHLPDQPANTPINFGSGWAVYEEVQAWRVRDLQFGTLTLEWWDGDSWEVYTDGSLSWTDGRFGDGSYAWGEPYAFNRFFRTDFEFIISLPAGDYRFTDIDFELSAGTVDASGGGDPPGPWMKYDVPCEFTVA